MKFEAKTDYVYPWIKEVALVFGSECFDGEPSGFIYAGKAAQNRWLVLRPKGFKREEWAGDFFFQIFFYSFSI